MRGRTENASVKRLPFGDFAGDPAGFDQRKHVRVRTAVDGLDVIGT
jgi:hypothetical protein